MTEKSKSNRKTKSAPLTASPQMWVLSPMISMVGMASWAELIKENAQFASKRLTYDMHAQRDLLGCRSIEQILRLQAKLYQETTEQYTTHAQRMVELLSEATALGWSEATSPRSREYDDIPL